MKMETEIKGKIYKIICNECEKFYIGCTTNTLSRRFYDHKYVAKKLNSKLYQHMREHDINNFKIILIEDVICSSKDALRATEDKFIRELKPELNMINAYLTNEQRKEQLNQYAKTDKRKEYIKQYHKNEKFIEYKKQYRKTKKDKDRQKQYKKTDKYKEQQKIYRQKVKQFRELMNELPIGLI